MLGCAGALRPGLAGPRARRNTHPTWALRPEPAPCMRRSGDAAPGAPGSASRGRAQVGPAWDGAGWGGAARGGARALPAGKGLRRGGAGQGRAPGARRGGGARAGPPGGSREARGEGGVSGGLGRRGGARVGVGTAGEAARAGAGAPAGRGAGSCGVGTAAGRGRVVGGRGRACVLRDPSRGGATPGLCPSGQSGRQGPAPPGEGLLPWGRKGLCLPAPGTVRPVSKERFPERRPSPSARSRLGLLGRGPAELSNPSVCSEALRPAPCGRSQ